MTTLADHARARTASEEHLCRVLELQPVCVTRLAMDGTFLAVNAAALAMLGGDDLDQVLGTSLVECVAPHERLQCREFLGRVAAGARRSAEFDITALDGTRRAVLLHAVPLPDPHDGIPSAVGVFHDVAEQRRLEHVVLEALERQLRRSERLAQVGRLAASIAGDVEDRFRTVADRLRGLVAAGETAGDLPARLAEIACVAAEGAALAQQIAAAARMESEN